VKGRLAPLQSIQNIRSRDINRILSRAKAERTLDPQQSLRFWRRNMGNFCSLVAMIDRRRRNRSVILAMGINWMLLLAIIFAVPLTSG
jgi:hypothetical protein